MMSSHHMAPVSSLSPGKDSDPPVTPSGVDRGIAVRVALLGHGHRDDPRLICVVHVGEGDLGGAGGKRLAAREELG